MARRNAGVKTLLVAFVFVVMSASLAGAATIDTYADWDTITTQGFFGNGSGTTGTYLGSPNSATYGQVVTARGTTLANFTFYMGQAADWGSLPFDFAAYVYAWDGAKASGPALWTSGRTAFPTSTTPQAVPFTPGITVASGSQYVLFVSVSNYAGTTYYIDDDFYGAGIFGFNWVPSTADAYFVYLNNGSDHTLWTSSDWDTSMSSGALAMQAEFSSVPLPGAVVLLGPGLLGLLALRRKTKR